MNKISIIVPVYNVEKYLNKCVDSLLAQTYKNTEIILVNDGSLDNCPAICDAYARLDKRVKVIHKINGGLSDARNAGIDIATGEYIICIDSDDYIDSDTIEFLYNSLTENDCDIATCRYRVFYDDDIEAKKDESNEQFILSSDEALEDMYYQKNVTNSAWAKLYKTDLFADIRYPVGKICEDLGTTYKLFSAAKKIALNSSKKYHYLQRKNSIINSKFSPNRMDALNFAKEQLDYTKTYHPRIINAAKNRLFVEAMLIAIEIPFTTMQFSKERRECNSVMRQMSRDVLMDKKSEHKFKVYARVAKVSVNLLISIFKLKKFMRSMK